MLAEEVDKPEGVGWEYNRYSFANLFNKFSFVSINPSDHMTRTPLFAFLVRQILFVNDPVNTRIS